MIFKDRLPILDMHSRAAICSWWFIWIYLIKQVWGQHLSWAVTSFFSSQVMPSLLVLISSGLSTLWISFTIKISKKFLGGSRPCRTETNGSLVAGPILDVIPCRLGFLTHIRTSSSCGFLTCACLCGFLVLIHLTHMLSVCSALPFW